MVASRTGDMRRPPIPMHDRGMASAAAMSTGQAREGFDMWFLIKGSFWFTLVLLALPLFEPAVTGERAPTFEGENAPSERIAIGQSFGVALEALNDIRAICERKPDVCEKGGETIAALGAQARDGARIAYQLLDDKFGGSAAEDQPAHYDNDAVTTGSVAPVSN